MPELVRRLVADDLAVRAVVPATDQGLEDFFLELTAPDESQARPAARPKGLAGLARRVTREALVSPGGVCACPPTPPVKAPAVGADGHRHGSTRAPMAGRAWGPLRREWTKLLFTRRTYVIWAGLLAIPGLITLALKLADSPPGPGEGPEFLSRVVDNGMYVPLASLAALLPFFLPLAAIMVASYMLAGEAELGTLRIVLLRPVDRGAMLLAKWVTAVTLPLRRPAHRRGRRPRLRRRLLRSRAAWSRSPAAR